MITNNEIVRILSEISEYLAIQDVPFKPRAYARAAQAISSLEQEAQNIYKEQGINGLQEIPGIGAHIAQKIEELIKTSRSSYLAKLKKQLPVRVDELARVEGIGPKMIAVLYKKLNIKTIKDLERAAHGGKIRSLPHFGEKSETKILKSIEFLKKSAGRILLGDALPIARRIESRLREVCGVKHATVAGSIRRMQETAGDIDILVTTSHPHRVMDTFAGLPEVQHIYSRGKTKTMVRLKIGIDADLRVVPEKSYGTALQYFTGDKTHNIEMHKIAIQKGYKLSEYGLFKGKKSIAARNEEEVYKKLGMEFIPPEIRTASGEIAAAQNKKLPRLIPYGSIKGDLQVQTSYTDGATSIEEMAHAAIRAGLEYIAITDHTKALAMTHGLDEQGLARQAKEIDAINKKFQHTGRQFRIFKSAEVNILKNGSLDIKDNALKQLDLVGISVHSHFNMTEYEMTERILRAMKNPYVNILFHPTGRLINRREPYKVNMLKIIKAAKQYGIALEVNSFPDRLDLKDNHIRLALEYGVKLVVDSDAHTPQHFGVLDLGIAQVRRGWGTINDVLNTKNAENFILSLNKLKNTQ